MNLKGEIRSQVKPLKPSTLNQAQQLHVENLKKEHFEESEIEQKSLDTERLLSLDDSIQFEDNCMEPEE